MEKITAKTRQIKGSRPCQKLRKTGAVPAVIYGGKAENILLELEPKELKKLLKNRKETVEVSIQGENKAETGSEKVKVQDIQVDTIEEKVLHIDLLRV